MSAARDRITPAQRSALDKLAPVLPSACYLAGGVAGGVTAVLPDLEQLPGVGITNRAAGTVYLSVDGVPVSLIQYRYPPVSPPARLAGLPIDVASLDDLVCMKLSAIAGRGAARDFWDLHAMIEVGERPLGEVIAVFRRKHPAVDIGHLVRSLAYFGDADAEPLPLGLTVEHWARIRDDFAAWITELLTME